MSLAGMAAPRLVGMSKRGRQRRVLAKQVSAQLLLIAGSLTVVMPVFYVISVSLRSPGDYIADPYSFMPSHPTLSNFTQLFGLVDVNRMMLNSLVVCAVASIGTVVSSAVVAYPLARFRFRGVGFITVCVLATIMLPPQVLLIPQYVEFLKFRWVNTFLPLMVPSWFATNGFMVFYLRQTYRTIPREMEEAVLVDGGGFWSAFRRVVLPLSKGPLMIVLILQVVATYNDFFAPSIYLQSQSLFTMPVGLQLAAATAGGGLNNAPVIMAGTVVYVVPLVIFFFVVQRWLVRGVQLGGAVKG